MVRSIAHKHRDDAEQVTLEILEEWIAGRGMHPVTWKTLTQVLHDIDLSTLASEIEASKYQEGIEAVNDIPSNQGNLAVVTVGDTISGLRNGCEHFLKLVIMILVQNYDPPFR